MSTWPSPTTTSGSPVPTANVDAPTDVPATARADLDTALQRINTLEALINQIINYGEPLVKTAEIALPKRAYTTPVAVAFNATLVIDAEQSNMFVVGTLTGNVTSLTISNPVEGQFLSIRFKQDATGGRSVVFPTGAKINGSTFGIGANGTFYLNITYNATDTRWEGNVSLVLP